MAATVLPAEAGAALVPPGNSAANQYTETFPTTGGNAEAKGKKATPGAVLGARNAEKLDSQGKQGREAAAVVAETAPPPVASEGGGSGESGGGDGSAAGGGAGGGGANDPAAASGEGASQAGPGAQPGAGKAGAGDTDGSSGIGEVLGQATGSSSSGGTGLLLPLIVLASAIWALAFFLRRRRPSA